MGDLGENLEMTNRRKDPDGISIGGFGLKMKDAMREATGASKAFNVR